MVKKEQVQGSTSASAAAAGQEVEEEDTSASKTVLSNLQFGPFMSRCAVLIMI